MLFVFGNALGQSQELDSLKEILGKADLRPAEEIDLLLKVGIKMLQYDEDAAAHYVQLGWQKSRNIPEKKAKADHELGYFYDYTQQPEAAKIHYKNAKDHYLASKDTTAILSINNDLFDFYKFTGQFAYCIEVMQESFNILQTRSDTVGMADALNGMANAYEYNSNFLAATEKYLESLDLFYKVHEIEQVGFIKGNLGILFSKKGDYALALEYYQDCIAIAKEIKNDLLVASTSLNMGVSLKKMGKNDEAIELYNNALQVFLEKDNHSGTTYGYHNLGEVYRQKGEYIKAINYYEKADDLARKYKFGKTEAVNLGGLAMAYYKINMNDRALKTANKALELAQKFAGPEEVKTIYEYISEIYQANGQIGQAFKYYKDYVALRDSIFDLEKQRQINEIQAKYEAEVQAKENEQLRREQQENEATIAQQQLTNFIISVVLITLVVGSVLLFIGYQVKNKSNQLLEKQKKEIVAKNLKLEELINENNSLMHIVVHDLKAPLNKVTGLMQLIRLDGTLSDAQKDYLVKMNAVVADGHKLIRDLLTIGQAEGQGLQLDLQVLDLNELLPEVVNAYSRLAVQKEIKLHYASNVAEALVEIDPEHLKRILDNLLSNAIKFSPFRRNIYVSLEKYRGNFQFNIKDEGPGISEEDQQKLFRKFQRLSNLPTNGESSNGLGLSIVKTLTEQLNGKVFVESALGEGTTFSVAFPAAKPQPVSTRA